MYTYLFLIKYGYG